MTTALLALLIFVLLVYHFTRTIKRVLVKPVAPDGRVGPELLATKMRWDVLKEWLKPWVWGVVVGLLLCPVVGGVMGWLE